MIELLTIGLASGIVTAVILIMYHRYLAYKKLITLKNYAENILEAFEERVVRARLEFDREMMICYNRETDEFIAQAKTWNELNEKLKERFPNKMFDVPQEQIDRAQMYDR